VETYNQASQMENLPILQAVENSVQNEKAMKPKKIHIYCGIRED
jgi:hypothetical protein